MNVEKFTELMKASKSTIDHDSSYKFAVQRCDDRDAYEVAFAARFYAFVSEYVDFQTFNNLTEDAAKEIIQRTEDRMVSLQKEISELIAERTK